MRSNDSDEVLIGVVVEESWLTLEQAAAACSVEAAWLLRHIEDDLLPGVSSVGGTWHLSNASLLRARRMRRLERDFDAGPELAALVSDMLDELDSLRRKLQQFER
ncbi:MAG: chaperone modulator CbpM [Steroidobacteraceae bacterium]